MKRTMRTAASILAATTLGSLAAGQIVGKPEIEFITPTLSYDAGPVVIVGRNLGTAARLYVDGVEVPMDVHRPRRIEFWRDTHPAELTPGFAEVTLDALGLGLETGVLELLPTLELVRRRNELALELSPGGPGLYSVYFSFEERPRPLLVRNVHYMLMLDLAPGMSGKLASGFNTSRAPLDVVDVQMPAHLALVGRDMYLQGWTQQGFTLEQSVRSSGGIAGWAGEFTDGGHYPVSVGSCFTNMLHRPSTPVEAGTDRTTGVDP